MSDHVAQTSNAPEQLDALTGLRAIAAWLVVLFHMQPSLAALLPQAATALFLKGYLAVDLFFLLSGFVLWHNYAERLAQGRAAAINHFLWRRFSRIWPLHALIMVAAVVFVLLMEASGRRLMQYPWSELPLHFLLLQNWGWTDDLTWNHPAWSISTEMAASLLFPALAMCSWFRRMPMSALLALAAALLAGLHLYMVANGQTTLGLDVARLGLVRCLIGFTVGVVVCRLWQSLRDAQRAGWLARIAMLAALLGWGLGLAETAMVPLAFAAGLLALALDQSFVSRLLSARWLVYLGEISYSTYLAHFLLFRLFKLAFVGADAQIGWLGMMGFPVLVLAASIALYHRVEKPAQRWLNAREPGKA